MIAEVSHVAYVLHKGINRAVNLTVCTEYHMKDLLPRHEHMFAAGRRRFFLQHEAVIVASEFRPASFALLKVEGCEG